MVDFPDDNFLEEPSPVRLGSIGDTRLTKLSIFQTLQNTWAFLDPESIPWKSYNDAISYFKVEEDPLGLVQEAKSNPAFYSDYVFTNQIVYRYLSEGAFIYGKVNTERELSNFDFLTETDRGLDT